MHPLQNLRVLNLAVNVPGPVAAVRLQQMGATVVKVEPPSGDPLVHYSRSWYEELIAGQEIVTLDLKAPEGSRRLHELLAATDLLITATRPAALDRLGLGWAALKEKFPKLCQVAIVGFPAPRENEAGHDLTYQAEMGLLTPPHMPRTLMSDLAGAEMAVSASLSLLLGRERGQGAGYEQVALSDAAQAMAAPVTHGVTAPGATLGGGIPEYNLYRTSNGWAAVAALEPHFKKRLTAGLGLDDLRIEPCREVFKTKTSDEWQEWGLQGDIPVMAVKDVPNQ